LPGKYARTDGCVLLAWSDREPAGVLARRTIGPGLAEMKRLYVRPAFRGLGIARGLASLVIADAWQAGISRIVLDTLGSMHAARALYAGLGFRPIPAYYENPLPEVVYLGLDLGG
jgi:putative acetyltransferase